MPAKGYKVKWIKVNLTEKQWSEISYYARDSLALYCVDQEPKPKWWKSGYKAIISLEKQIKKGNKA